MHKVSMEMDRYKFTIGSDCETPSKVIAMNLPWYGSKRHISIQDLSIPGSDTGLLINSQRDKASPGIINPYRHANRLSDYGFNCRLDAKPLGAMVADSGADRGRRPFLSMRQ